MATSHESASVALEQAPPADAKSGIRTRDDGAQREIPMNVADSPAVATAAWYRGLPKDTKRRIRALHRHDGRAILLILAFPALWAVAGYWMLRDPSWLATALGTLVIASSIHALGILGHDTAHHTLFSNRHLNRWGGFLLWAPAMVSASCYKLVHVFHHRYLRTPKDPDDMRYASSQPRAFFWVWLFGGAPLYVLFALPRNGMLLGKPDERRAVLLEYAALLAILVTVIACVPFALVFKLWLVPWLLAGIFVQVRGISEHPLTPGGSPLRDTRTVTSNRLVSFLMCNLNYHLEHHLFPGVPWYNLPAVHRELRGEFEQHGSSLYSSYVQFLVDAVRVGPDGVTPR
jgi:fatty acid desaturase